MAIKQGIIESGINEHKLRLVTVYKEDGNKTIEIITNNMDWTARTIADLYKKRWDIEFVFQVNEAKSADKNLSWYERKCDKVSDLYSFDLPSSF